MPEYLSPGVYVEEVPRGPRPIVGVATAVAGFAGLTEKGPTLALAISGWDQFQGNSPHRPWVDAVKIRCAQCGDENASRVKDVGTPWLDASIVPFSTMGLRTYSAGKPEPSFL